MPTFPLKFEFDSLNWDWNLNFEYRAFFPFIDDSGRKKKNPRLRIKKR